VTAVSAQLPEAVRTTLTEFRRGEFGQWWREWQCIDNRSHGYARRRN
jgi:hypothetical protein